MNIIKYRSRDNHTKMTQANSPDEYASRKSSLSLAERIHILDSIERGYNLYKNSNNNIREIKKKPKRVLLQPISQTLQLKK